MCLECGWVNKCIFLVKYFFPENHILCQLFVTEIIRLSPGLSLPGYPQLLQILPNFKICFHIAYDYVFACFINIIIVSTILGLIFCWLVFA